MSQDDGAETLPSTLGAREPDGARGDASIHAFLTALAARDVRLSLDGERLKVNAPAGSLDDESKATLVRRKAEVIAALAGRQSGGNALRRVPRDGPLPLSFAQQRLWFLDRMQPGSAHYNIAVALRFVGALEVEAIRAALDEITRRHESLRLRVREEDGNPRAEIGDDLTAPLVVIDVSQVPDAERGEEQRRVIAAQAAAPFDLARGPLARFVLVRSKSDEHVLLIVVHHIAADGWSLSVIAREIAALYDAIVVGKPSPLTPLTVQYVDYAAWQREQMNSGVLVRQLSFWQSELMGAPAVIELPTDRPRPAMQSFRGGRFMRTMPAHLLDAIRAASRAHDATMFMTLLAAWQVLLARYSGQDDIMVGSPMANRDRPELEPLIGLFVNNVVLRGRVEGNPTFAEFLARTKAAVLRAFDHRELPFDRLVEGVRPERSTSHSPLFQTMLTLHSFPIVRMRPSGLMVEQLVLGDDARPSSRFDVTLDMDEHDGELRMHYEFARDLFDPSTIDRLHTSYLTLLQQLAADPMQRVRDVPMLDDAALGEILDRVNDTAFAHDRAQRLDDLVRLSAARTPDAVAIVAEDASLTYAELECRSAQLANLLVARGVRRGALVGVCLDRTSALPVALLGVLKAGAAYVPLDPGHPAERLAYTLTDARVACVVTESRLVDAVRAAEVPLVLLDREADALAAQASTAPAVGGEPGDLAYVIYTSGSTGRPKGVEIEHRNLVNFLRGMQREPGIGPDDVLVAVTTPSFDIAGLELFLPLVAGARTVIASRADVLDGERLVALAERAGATMMQATPATWRLMIDAGWEGRAGLTALCGGEALPRDLARELLVRVGVLWNMYGPTETTVWSTVHRVTDAERDVPIGHPIANTTVYVLDAVGRPAPIGVAGELCIGGEGVARGYRERPELTAEKFVTVSLAGRAPERIYRTGDVVRLRADLSLEFVGRRDHQVKVRGYRIELGEIESVLGEHAEVRRCVVIVREDAPGDVRLVAYVVPAGTEAPPPEALRALLRSRLPDYMVPSAIVALPELPLTPNGKIDRKALPAPAASRTSGASIPEAVMTEPQKRIAAIWRDVLRLERVGLHENFFDLGGHSLLVVKVHAALRRDFGAELTVVDLFQRTTVASQADLLADTTSRDAGLHRAQARLARQVLV